MGRIDLASLKTNSRLWARALFSGEKCAACGEPDTKGSSVLCPSCIEKLNKKANDPCPRCKSPARKCRCVRKNMAESGIICSFKLGFYHSSEVTSPLNRVIFRLKRNRDRLLTDCLAERLAPEIAGYLAAGSGDHKENAIVTYVPRSRKKALSEGTDQAKLLAASLAEKLELTSWGLIGRAENGKKSQKRLAVSERDENVGGMFFPLEAALTEGRTVILVDDLITTGATVSEAAGVLRTAGAADVICVSIAEA